MHAEISTPVAARLLLLARRNVRSKDTPLHTAADRYVNAVTVAVMYAFMVGKKVLNGRTITPALVDKAADAVAAALEESLPPVLLKVITAGGEAGVAGLRKLRGLGGPGSGWTAENGHVPGLTSPSRLDVKREIIGAIDSRGSVTAKNTTPQFNDHTQMGTASRPGSQRFRVNGNEVQWDDDPEDDDRFAVEDWLAKRGLDGVRHVVLAKKFSGLELRTAKPAAKKPLRMRFNVTDPNVVKAAKKHAAKLVTDITKTTRKRIHDAIVGAVEGDGFTKAYKTILDAVGDKDRARLIARNETMMAANEGQRQSWNQAVEAGLLDEDSKRVWITTPDDRLCPICEPLEGETADLDGLYVGEFEGPPAHVACRCTEGIVS